MTNATLRGKPDAGNPHVRFDEGEVASAKPRRGSLLYRGLLGLCVAFCAASALGENLALGKPYTLSTAPNYSFCKDADDMKQLTDGQHVKGYFWTQKGTVGWQRPAGGAQVITVDLGKSEPIGGFAYTLAAGRANVFWPKEIAVFTSDDKKSWTLVGDLWARAKAKGDAPAADDYRIFRASADDMPCRGRYVAFLVVAQPYGFCDEVEVFRGADSAQNPAQAKVYGDVREYLSVARLREVIAVDAVRLGVPMPDISSVAAPAIKNLRTELPMLPAQAAVWAHNVDNLAKAGFKKPVFWKNNRWDNLDPLAVPTKESVNSQPLVMEMMRGETRATALNLLNPTKEPITTTVAVKGLPATANLDCREVLYTLGTTDSNSGDIGTVASALKPGDGDSVRITVPAGTSRQIWISFNKPSGAAGTFDGKVMSTVGATTLEQPIRLVLHDLDFPKQPRLHVGGWDYTDGEAAFYKRPQAFAADKRAMLEMFTDTPWGSPNVFPKNAKFDAEGHLLNAEALDFARLDGWVAKWPEARQFAAFYAAQPKTKFFGEAPGSARFDRMVGEYFAAWQAHLAKVSGGKEVLLLILDEPRTAADTPVYAAWAKAVRKGAPKIRIFVDPIYPDNLKTPREVIDTSDIICPYYPRIQGNDWGTFWRDQTAPGTGRELYFYSCKVAARFLDPAFYHRAQAWGAFQWGAKSSFFWAFGDGGGAAGSFNLFGQTNAECSPYFAYPEGTMASKQSEGVREGVEDYEYLAMLSDREKILRAQGKDTVSLIAFLATAPYRALGDWKGQDWQTVRSRESFDKVRIEVLRLLSAHK